MAILVEFTPVFNEREVTRVIKKAWRSGFRLVGRDSNQHTMGTEQLADVLQIADRELDMHPVVVATYIYWGLLLGLIHDSPHRGYLVAY